ncbi:MAG: hypothetical protein EBV28_09265 [Betaproteobacteria bacterium]|nr:hypothetical protein [Betaproteobacteria bacterium]
MWPVLRELLRELFKLGLGAAGQWAQEWRDTCIQALERERQRLFEGLALLCLGLVLFTLGLTGLLLLGWWALPADWRLPVMATVMFALTALGWAVLGLARRRWVPSG